MIIKEEKKYQGKIEEEVETQQLASRAKRLVPDANRFYIENLLIKNNY